MKVIAQDNYARDYIDDVLIQEGLSRSSAEQLAYNLNTKSDPRGLRFYRAVEDDYTLKMWEP